MNRSVFALLALLLPCEIAGYAFVARRPLVSSQQTSCCHQRRQSTSGGLKMLDSNIVEGAGIAIAGLAVGIGLVAFTEAQGERAKARGAGLSDSMSTKIAGGLMEDVEVSSVSDLGSLTSQLEQALKESGGAEEDELEMSEEDKKRIEDEADDGW